MKKNLIILFVLVSSAALGQKHFAGIQGGLNFTNFSSKEILDNTQMRTGFIGGITYGQKLKNKYRMEVDILYSQQGITDNLDITDENGVFIGEEENKMNYDYLSIPIKFGYELGNKIKLIPKIGIVPAISIKAEIISPTFDGSGIATGKEIINHKDYISKFDFGGIVEIGIERDLSKSMILCSNYKHSLTTFLNSNFFEGNKIRHYGFSVSVGLKYLFNE